ncbi:hypothetical protein OPV22_030975 [Ensete ventricosum]|uniref:Uncharacterized protein n=1 Tax=Ensete ventricosum TaxID=4639 RepID=A0AAV8PII8_ENSVE|nr:hypothetical protein OPV22_030975 [Ensete ventricosum]
MNSTAFFVVLSLLLATSLCLEADPSHISNVTVMGTVFCDACATNVFSEHSYFLAGVRVRVQCMLRVMNSTSREEMSITVDRRTDKFGVYKLDIPPVDGLECREGVEMDSCCRASLLGSPSSLCDVPGLSSSTGHVAVGGGEGKRCLYNLNALNYRPSKKDANLCGTGTQRMDGHQVAPTPTSQALDFLAAAATDPLLVFFLLLQRRRKAWFQVLKRFLTTLMLHLPAHRPRNKLPLSAACVKANAKGRD